MNKSIYSSLLLSSALALTACGGGGGGNPTSTTPDVSAPETYTFESKITSNESAVSYTGQTTRQVLIEDLITEVLGLTEDPGNSAAVESDLTFYVSGNPDNVNHNYTIAGETIIPGPTYGSISTDKNLSDKIAGGNGNGGGETSKLINNEFFGWEDGIGINDLPIELVGLFIERIAQEATDGTVPSIAIAGGTANLDLVYVDAEGRDYRQLLQKFLLGAVGFSQGTNDYLKTDFANSNSQDGSKPYTVAEHKWDEGFGYFGAARNYNDFTDEEIAKAGGRSEFAGSYNDANGDGDIDLRSEINLANSTNCAKRDRGSTTGTDFSKEVFDAFLAGRFILNQAAENLDTALSNEQQTALDEQIQIAALTWEKCIAATVVHYINDVIADMGDFSNGKFADLANFKNLAKHWGEMKGFALGLQFSPYSPFRDGSVTNIGVTNLKDLLSAMGDAPVLADGSQNGVPPSGTAEGAINDYIDELKNIRSVLQTAYQFAEADVLGW